MNERRETEWRIGRKRVKGICRREEGVRRENESAPCHECNRSCGRRKIHDQDAIATRDRTRENSQTPLNQQIRPSECRAFWRSIYVFQESDNRNIAF